LFLCRIATARCYLDRESARISYLEEVISKHVQYMKYRAQDDGACMKLPSAAIASPLLTIEGLDLDVSADLVDAMDAGRAV